MNPRLRLACLTLFFVAGLNLAVGLARALFRVSLLEGEADASSLVLGVCFLALAVLVWRRSLLALVAALLLFGIQGIREALSAYKNGLPMGFIIGLILIRIVVLAVMARGIGPLRGQKQAE